VCGIRELHGDALIPSWGEQSHNKDYLQSQSEWITMTVAIVTGVYPPLIGGSGAVMHSLAVNAPDQITVITSEFDGDGNRIRAKVALHTTPDSVFRIPRLSHNLNWLPMGKFRAVCQAVYDRTVVHPPATHNLLRLLGSLRPEAVCIGTLSSCYWVVSAVRKWREDTKIIVYVHGEEVPNGKGYFNKIRLRALQNASALVAVSSFTKNSLINTGIPPGRITVITNGVDTTRFQPGEKSQGIIDRYGLANRCVLLTLARLDERKGQDMMIRALPKVREAVPDVVYLVVGEGGYGGTLRRLVADLHLEDAVIFTGAVSDDDAVDFYRTCDAYIMPNRTLEDGDTEGFGLVFLEAGACGKPVIGGNAGGVPDAIVNEVTGLLVDGTSIEAIADSCIRLLKDSGLRTVLGANGLAHARKNDWRIKTQQFLKFCNTVVHI
jgi:phosphatidylinositol alpha-1,6-mannosyltransferase